MFIQDIEYKSNCLQMVELHTSAKEFSWQT